MKSTPSFTWSQDIRTRRFLHRFGGVWVQAIVVTAPWLTVILIVGALFIVHGRIAITPGVLFDLPPTPLTEGA
ncbi:MAG: hypothetical protein FWH21_09435, partial [Kiritimatiellaeota bacterium]|nr:hypothetical protein [Kiritimatiellota bacterium]